MTLDPVTLVVFALAVALLGLSKGGLSGVGMMAMPLMLFVMPPTAAASVILPVLLTQDAFSVWLYRGRWDVGNLKLLLPAAAVGIVVGVLSFAVLPREALLVLLGVVTLVFALRGLARRGAAASVAHPATGLLLGALSGFTSTVLHHGGPPFQMYLLPQKLPRDVFVATSVAFFATVNWLKVPGFLALGQLTREVLTIALVAAPYALAMTLLGARLVRRIAPERFYVLIHLILVAVSIKLIADGAL
ncbi:sulfite exporter TauE/SafE family protein [Acuticoccus sp.]|uniref:sulfite exporter TauE/SafE family protein n=1 Tax=Acuticoccus sp. TaxID=1904378 RepID=UPI003B52B327